MALAETFEPALGKFKLCISKSRLKFSTYQFSLILLITPLLLCQWWWAKDWQGLYTFLSNVAEQILWSGGFELVTFVEETHHQPPQPHHNTNIANKLSGPTSKNVLIPLNCAKIRTRASSNQELTTTSEKQTE